MCGIAGALDLGGGAVPADLLRRMCGALRHRGPDEEGYFHDGPVALGQMRLSIIDLSSGKQPMANEDGTVWVTFNGEIYNFHELRHRLEGLGHRFATHSDTEVIVHAYEQYGTACLDHFRGMFAFAVWDGPRRTLFLARDRAGKKPLFHARVANQFVFASELQGLLQHPALSRDPDFSAIDEYLTYGYIPAPRTAYRAVCKLPPAHYLLCRQDTGDIRVERYWQLRYQPKLALDENEAAEALEAELTEAVRLRLIADVPLGALLSGGVDSSLVVALMSRASSRPVKTFSIGFEEQAFNELPHARAVARQYATEHHELVVRASALEVLPTLIRHYGEPFADSSAVPSYYVAQLARQHVKVALNGDGGDESFAGYDRYRASVLGDRLDRLPWLARRSAGWLAGLLIPDSLPRRSRLHQARRFLQSLPLPAARRYLRWTGLFTPQQKQHLYTPQMRGELAGHDAEAWLLEEYETVRREGCAGLDAILALDVRSYLPFDLLVKMDIASMACSLEARSPLLDHKVMEFAARLPAGHKLHGTTLKYLLKKVAGRLLPGEVLHRRKMGFGVPVGDWMRGELRGLVEDMLLSSQTRLRTYFQSGPLHQLVEEHLGRRQDHSHRLWALLCLELWHREFLS
jgi:asparagine synthase (glutamine-hydrolysing)